MTKLKNEKLIEFRVLNENGRIYHSEEFTKTREEELSNGEIETFTLLDKINKNGILGEIGHKNSGGDVDNPSHLITNFRIEDNVLLGDVQSSENECTEKLFNLLIESGKVIFRPRSIGEINEDSTVSLKEIISFDLIHKDDDAFFKTNK